MNNLPRFAARCALLCLLVAIFPIDISALDFIHLGSEWKFFRGSSAPSSPMTEWRQPGFDDSGWESGAASIGYGDNDDQTHLDDMRDNYYSVYARQTFQVTDLASVRALRLVINFDDGFVAYLNGHEVGRSNAGSVGEELGHRSPATGDQVDEGGPLEEFDLSSHLHRLVEGENLIAFEVHNVMKDSSDLSFDALLSDDGPPIEIFDFGSDWRFLRGDSAPPANWREPTFDHSSWEVGPASIGYGDGDDETHLSDMENNYLSVYVRKRFNVTDVSGMLKLFFIVDYDDGIVAYLNGEEIARRHCGDFGEELEYDDPATIEREAGSPEYIDITDHIDDLVLGDNFLAIEVHNVTVESSDFSIDVRLAANERPEQFSSILGLRGDKASWGDFNNDGLVDVITSHVWRNDGDANFTEFTRIGDGIWGDFDNDGFLDIFAYGERKLYRNINGESFLDVSSMLPSLPMSSTRGAAWADFDGDSFIDLYVAGFEIWPNPYQPDAILMNEGGQSFRLAWTQSGDVDPARGIASVDYDQDGDMDVYVSNYRLEQNQLWTNNGSATFTNLAPVLGVEGIDGGWPYGHTIGSAFGDLDDDGHIDLFVGNFSHADPSQDRSRFYRNLGPFAGWAFEDRSDDADLSWEESFGSPSLGDMDNDGDLDFYLTTVNAGANAGVLYENNRDFRFLNVTSTTGAGIISRPTYQSSWADIDNDGDLDFITGGHLHRNTGNGNNWLKVRLHGDGVLINRAAIGAQVRASVNDRTMTRFVGDFTGEGNQNDLTLHFGLSTFDGEVPVEIFWPDGTTDYRTASANQTVEFTYGDTFCESVRVLPESYLDDPDEAVLVQLHVRNTTGTTLVQDTFPQGWVVVDNGGGQVIGDRIEFSTAEDTVLSYTVTPTDAACGTATFDGTFNGPDGCTGGTRGSTTIECESIGIPTTLVEEGDAIVYHRGSSAPAAGWRNIAFNDAAWTPGSLGIGYGDGDDRTVIDDMEDSYKAVFGRAIFDPRERGVYFDEVRGLRLRVIFDDGCAVYLNGTEIARPNMSLTGTINEDTFSDQHVEDAPSTCESDAEGCHVTFVPADLLIDGDNVLAFSVHNDTISSSDLTFIPTLEVFTRSRGTRFRRGDVDLNGDVDIVDVMRILRWQFLGVEPPSCLDSADADNDGQPTIVDPQRVVQYLFLAGPAPEAPGPTTCGRDDDYALGCESYAGCN